MAFSSIASLHRTKIRRVDCSDRTTERHRYEFNNVYHEKMEKRGLIVSALTFGGKLGELADHPWFPTCQFHPQFQSKPQLLFNGFVKPAVKYSEK